MLSCVLRYFGISPGELYTQKKKKFLRRGRSGGDYAGGL